MMIKIHPLFISATLLFFCSSAHAQYTQMIVDNNNRVMPIFFHDNINHQSLPFNQTRPSQVRPASSVKHRPTPATPTPRPTKRIIQPIVIPNKAPQPPQAASRNPLTGPYFISPQRHRVMAAAHKLLGTPYIYGGNNPARGLDCSSLMQFIYKNALGVSIPRTAAQQRDRSKRIAYQNLQPGDMLFFKIDRRNNHVGIYIGEGKFIHASASNRRATIASMSLPYWKKRFIKFGSYLDG